MGSKLFKQMENQSILEECEINSIHFSQDAGEIEFLLSVDNNFRIEYQTNKNITVEYDCKCGIVNFRSKRQHKFIFEDIKTITKVFLPNHKYKDMDISIGSGKFLFCDTELEMDNLHLNIASGNIRLDRLNVTETVRVNYASGTIYGNKITAKVFDISGVSGCHKLSDIVAEDCNINLTSGSFYIDTATISKDLNIDITSGKFFAERLDINGIKFNAVSGNAEFYIMGASEAYKFNCTVMAGEVKIHGKGLEILASKNMSIGTGTKIIDTRVISGKINYYFE